MPTIEVLGWIAFLITLVFTCVGLPVQIYRNHATKSVGFAIPMIFLQLLTFSSWVIYGLSKNDWYIVGSNFPGAIGILIILCQCWIYRGASRFRLRSTIMPEKD